MIDHIFILSITQESSSNTLYDYLFWLLFTLACLNFCMLKAGILDVASSIRSYLSKVRHLLGGVCF